ncbi:hypothetical protein MTO96_005779 [Rhipicephalus appendiculatus]
MCLVDPSPRLTVGAGMACRNDETTPVVTPRDQRTAWKERAAEWSTGVGEDGGEEDAGGVEERGGAARANTRPPTERVMTL